MNAILFSTRFGQHFSSANAVALDGRGSVFVAGTANNAFPIDWPVPDAEPPSRDKGFLAVLGNAGESIDDLVYIGGPASSITYDVAVDAVRQRVFVVGETVPSGVAAEDVFVPDAQYALLRAYAIEAEAAYGHSAKFVCGSPANPAPIDHWRINNGTYGTSIMRVFGVGGEDDTLSIIVTVSPSAQEQILDNNSFERTYWVPDC